MLKGLVLISLLTGAVLALNVDNCRKLQSHHSCRCLEAETDDDDDEQYLRQLKCNSFKNGQELKEALDIVRGLSFFSIDISDGNLIPYPNGLFKEIEALDLTFTDVKMDSTFKMSDEVVLSETLQSLSLTSVQGFELVEWDKAFSSFWSLFKLTIRKSPFSIIPVSANTTGAWGSSLTILNVNDNGVKCIDDLSLSTLSEAKVIDLSNNKLKEIRREVLPICTKRDLKPGQSCLKLEFLNLSDNLLRHVPDNLLNDFPELNKVFLDGNQLTTLNQEMVINIAPKLKHNLLIEAAGNPFNCECETMKWVLKKRGNIRIFGSCQGHPNYSMIEILKNQQKCL